MPFGTGNGDFFDLHCGLHVVFTGPRENVFMISAIAHGSSKQKKTPSSPGTDRRRVSRYAFLTTLRYRVAGETLGSWKNGRTLNMSGSGILVGCDETPPCGSRLELMIDWPGLMHGTPRMRLAVFGEVVRCEGPNFAVRILRHDFRSVVTAVRVASPRIAAAM